MLLRLIEIGFSKTRNPIRLDLIVLDNWPSFAIPEPRGNGVRATKKE